MSVMPDKDALILAAASKSITFFVRRLLGAEPTKQQAAVLFAIDKGAKKIAIKSGHGSGKSALLSWIILWALLFKEDCKVPMTAPSAPQLTDILIPEIRKWAGRLPEVLQKNIEVLTDKARNLENGNFAVARTARRESPEALQGFHGTNIFFILEEASGIPREIFEVAEGALTSDEAFAIMTGNPTRTEGYFYDAFHKNAWQWTRFTFNTEKSENVSRKTIEEYRRKYGVESDVYRVRVLGEFPKESGDAVFALYMLEEAIERDIYDDSGAEIWGLDIGGNNTDSDATVLVKRKGAYFYEAQKWHGMDLEDIANRLYAEFISSHRKPAAIFADETGQGKSFPSMAQKRGLPVYGVNFGRIKDDMYWDNRTKLYYKLKEILPQAKLFKPDYHLVDEMLGDLMAQQFEIVDGSKLRLLNKKKYIIPKLGRSPDLGDAMSLSCQGEFYIFENSEVEDEYWDDDEPIRGNAGGIY